MTSSQRHDRRLHIVHIITDLYGAGAEMMLYKVLAHMDRTQFTAEVITLAGGTAVRKLIEAIDIPVQSLDLPPSLTSGPSGLWRLGRILNERPGALVQTWMYHADMLGGLSTLLAQRQPVLWDIQGSALDAATTPWTTRGVIKACAKLSWRLPRRIVCCGHTARRVHVELGYDGNRMVVIPNAVDVSQFKPDATARQDLRRELGLGHDEVVLGMAARFNPQKDHATLVRALALLRTKRRVDFRVILCGINVTERNDVLTGMLDEAGCRGHVRLLGPRGDVARIFAACDLACLSSAYGEGLPNVVAEAMACGAPCVVTDVGDSGWVVGETGRVVPPRSPEALAGGLADLMALPPGERRRLGEAARHRVVEQFEIRAVAARYHALYEEVLGIA